MFAKATNAFVGKGRQVLKNAWFKAERYGKIIHKPEKLHNPSASASRCQVVAQDGVVSRLTARNVYPSLVQQMRSRFSGSFNSGSSQVFGNFHGLRSKVAFGFVGVFALQQAQSSEERHEAVFDDIRGMFCKTSPVIERRDDKLANYELAAPLSARAAVAVYEARLKVPDLEDDFEVLVESGVDEVGASDQTDACEGTSEVHELSTPSPDRAGHPVLGLTPDAETQTRLTYADAATQCQLLTGLVPLLRCSTCDTEWESAVPEILDIDLLYEVITEEQVEELPPQEFDCNLDDKELASFGTSSVSCGQMSKMSSMFESYEEISSDLVESAAPMVFSVRDDVCQCSAYQGDALDLEAEDSDIEVLEDSDLDIDEVDHLFHGPQFTPSLVQDLVSPLGPLVDEHVDPPPSDPPDGTADKPKFDLAIKMLLGQSAVSGLQMEMLPNTPTKCTPFCTTSSEDEGSTVDLPPHPNIIQVYGSFVEAVPWLSLSMMEEEPHLVPAHLTADGLSVNPMGFLVMKRYTWTLVEYLADHMLSVWEKLLLLTQLLEAVHHIHSHGIAHRKIEASNILVESDADNLPHLVLSAFGHAKQVEERSDVEHDLDAVVYIAKQLLGDMSNVSGSLHRAGSAVLQQLMSRLVDGNWMKTTPLQTVLTILHLILWQPSHDPLLSDDLALDVKVMPWLLNIAASILLQTRQETTGDVKHVTFALQSEFISRISKEDIEEAIGFLLE